MSDDCTFSEHIKNTCQVVNDLSSWSLRTFNNRSPELMLTLWKQLIMPKADYCSQLWNPQHSKSDIQDMEMLQRAFIRRIEGMANLSYWEQLKKLKLYSLERRRERYLILYVWYILENLVPNLENSSRKIEEKWHLRHGRKCIVPIVKKSGFTHIISSTLPVHGAKLFNAIPGSIRNLTGCTKEKFKKELDTFLTNIPDEPQIRTYTVFRRAESSF